MALNQLGLGFLFTAKDMATGVMSKIQKSLAQTRDSAGKFTTINKEAFAAFGVGAGMFIAGAGGLMLFNSALEQSSQYGTQMGQIRTVIDEAALSTAKAQAATMGLADTYGIGAIQGAEALYETISAGVTDAAQATDLLGVASQFAVGGNTELKGAVDVLTSSVNAYSASGLTAKQASDVLFTTVAAGKTTAGELSQSLGEVLKTAEAMGMGFDELGASIALLTVNGIKTPQAMTGLNAALANIATPSKDASDEAKRLGIQFDFAALKSKGLAGVLNSITSAAGYTDESLVKMFGSIDGKKVAMVLAANDGKNLAKMMDQTTAAMKLGGDQAGSTASAFEIMAQTTAFQEKRFAALKQNAMVLVGQAIDPLKVAVYKLVNGLLVAFAKIPAPVLQTMARFAAMAAVFLSVVGAALALKSAFSVMSGVMAVAKLKAAAFLAPLWPVVIAVGALVAGLALLRWAINNNIGGMGVFKGTLDKVRLAFEAVMQLFTQGGFSGKVLEELEAGNSGVETFAVTLFVWWNRVKAFFGGISDAFTAFADNAAFADLKDALLGVGIALDKVNPAENERKFGQFATTGQNVGKVLAVVVGGLVRILALGIRVGVAIGWLTSKFVSVFNSCVDLRAVVWGLGIAIGLLAGMIVSKGIVALVGLAVQLYASAVAAGGFGGMLAFVNSVSIVGAVAAGARALWGFAVSAAAAAGPGWVFVIMIGAIIAAVSQLFQLMDELGESGWSDMWKKLKNDLGFTTDAEYRAELGIGEAGMTNGPGRSLVGGADERTEFGPGAGQGGPVPNALPASMQGPPPMAPLPPAPQEGGDGNMTASADKLATAAETAASAWSKPQQMNMTLQLTSADGEALASFVTQQQTSSSGRKFF